MKTDIQTFKPVAMSAPAVLAPPEPDVPTDEPKESVILDVQDVQDESLTSDLEIEPLTIAALELSALGAR
jgi:hypothetical protein